MKKLRQKSVDELAQDDTVVNSKAGIQIQAISFPIWLSWPLFYIISFPMLLYYYYQKFADENDWA